MNSNIKEKLPEKTSQWLGSVDLAKRITGMAILTSNAYKAIKGEWEIASKEGSEKFSVAGVEIETNMGGMFQSRGGATFCVHESMISKVKEVIEAQKKAAKALKPTRERKQYGYFR